MDAAVLEDSRAFVDNLNDCFSDLKDPRVVGRCDHRLNDIVAIALLAVLCGAEDFPEVEEFGRRRRDWLEEFLELPHGIPSHDTFRRVFGAMDRNQFATCLFRWTQALHSASDGKLIAIDGKSLRRSLSKKLGLPPLHLVTAWASDNSLTLGQVACEDDSNEITAIPELLQLLNLRRCTVTIDAIGCQTGIAAQIRKQGGHYVLALKDNQPGTANDLQVLYADSMDLGFANVRHARYETREQAHGREEQRTCDVIEIPKDHRQRAKWKDLRSVVLITSHRTVGGKQSCECRWYITSHGLDAEGLSAAIRKHWRIANSQHWSLDVTFGEDWRRQQDRNAAENLGAVRRLALSLLRQEKTNKRGLKNKRFACALDPQYLIHVLANAQF